MYRIMAENNLLCRKSRKYRVKTTDSQHGFKKYRNILKTSTISAVNQAYVGDVTQFSIRGRNAYLALLTDLHNREIVGFALSATNDTSLVTACLRRALEKLGFARGCDSSHRRRRALLLTRIRCRNEKLRPTDIHGVRQRL